MIRGVLFDKDDTLLDLATFWRKPVAHTVSFILHELECENDNTLRRDLERAAGFEDGSLIPESPVVSGTNTDVIRAMMEVLATHNIHPIDAPLFARLAETHLEYACLRHGVCQATGDLAHVLDTLHAQGMKIGVATSDSYASTIHALEKMGVAEKIDCILTADRVARPKPAPDMAMIFCARFALAPEEVAMVGDSANDMRFAHAAGLTAIYLDRTNATNIDCNAKPVLEGDHHIQHIEDVVELFTNL